MKLHAWSVLCGTLGLLVWSGCTTSRQSDTQRTAMEQMLISNAVDRALSQIDLSVVQGQPVYLETKYLDAVDQGYILGTLRHQVLAAGGQLVDEQAESTITLEVRSGGVGTDNVDRFVGFPGMALPGPMPVELPEVPLWNRITQFGTAKLGVAAYATESRQMLQCGGQFLARSDESQWTVLGIGPFGGGSVRRELKRSTVSDPAEERLAAHALPTFYRSTDEPYADPLMVAMNPAANPTPTSATVATGVPTLPGSIVGLQPTTPNVDQSGGALQQTAAPSTSGVAPAAAVLGTGPDQRVQSAVGTIGESQPGLTGAAAWPQ